MSDQSEDMIARRMVMRREVWDMLVELARAMSEERGHVVTPVDVATLAIEAGVRRGIEKHPLVRKSRGILPS